MRCYPCWRTFWRSSSCSAPRGKDVLYKYGFWDDAQQHYLTVIGVASNRKLDSHLWCTSLTTYSQNQLEPVQVDRAVKIWRMPYVDYRKVKEGTEHLAREDKPLFTTDLIHDARVLSIWWYVPRFFPLKFFLFVVRLGRDILISHSAPALMRGKSINSMREECGTSVVWQWLGYDRYLGEGGLKPIMRGNCEVRLLTVAMCNSHYMNWLTLCIQDWCNSGKVSSVSDLWSCSQYHQSPSKYCPFTLCPRGQPTST